MSEWISTQVSLGKSPRGKSKLVESDQLRNDTFKAIIWVPTFCLRLQNDTTKLSKRRIA